jgi:alpha-ribazole phosphatase/probable phosphoglycerate mutase
MNKNKIETTSIWLIRHGEPDADSRGRCYGRMDVGLSSEGHRQVEAVSQALQNELFTAIYVSPCKRAVESGKLLAHGHSCVVTLDERLHEIDFGDLEGNKYDDIAKSYPDIYRQWMKHPTETQFPNGESFQQMHARVLDAAHQLYRKHRGETIAIVSHGGVNRILLADALGIPNANIFRVAQRYAAINLLRLIDDYPSVELMNANAN